jgi:hypothetical protein
LNKQSRVLSISNDLIDKYLKTKKDMEKSFPAQITLKDSQFIEILINFYLENKDKE